MTRRYIPGSQNNSSKDARGAYIKKQPEIDLGPFRLDSFLFEKQLKFVEDPRPFKISVCSRRAGKTIACAAHLINVATTCEQVICLYITLSRNNAKKLIWPEIQKINRDYKLKGIIDGTELSITFPNGSVIYLSGAKDASEIEKFRGLPIKLAYVDECQSFREYIRDLIDDVIAPALMDHAGSMCLIGTPGPLPTGYFAEIDGQVPDKIQASEAWSRHGWTFFDNPFITKKSGLTHQELLDRELRRRGVTADDPSIQREWFGRWVLDSDALWIHYDKVKNHYEELPDANFSYILGIDLGFNDADALAVLGWSETLKETYLIEELVRPKQGITEIAEQIKSLQKRYDITKMVIDAGGLGKKIAEELIRRHGLPLEAADKARKQENVAFLNDALRTGKFKAKQNSNFAKDSCLVEIDRDKSTPESIKLSDRYHSDIIDAVLYAFKESPAYAFQSQPTKPKYGTKEWALKQQEDMWDQAHSHFTELAERRRREDGLD